MNAVRRLVRCLVALLCLSVATAQAQIDPFYTDLERDAATAAAKGDARRAARLYRIACFGMLDEPVRLAACTVRLALSQAQVGDQGGFSDSFSRLATVEERFQGWTLADLSSEEREQMAKQARAWLPEPTLAAIPAIAALAQATKASEAKAAPVARGRRKEVKSAPPPPSSRPSETPSRDEPAEPELEALAAPPVAAAATPPASAEKEVAPPTAREALSDVEQSEVRAARELLGGSPDRVELETALGALRAVADRHPENPEPARLVGDLAYRLSDWRVCADYYGRAGDPGAEAPLERFYMAVCLYEAGQLEAAAALLAPSAGQLKRSPFVESYLTKILSPSKLP